MENKTVSLQEVYNQVQEMLDNAGIPTATLWVEGKVCSYQHIKNGTYNRANMTPEKEIRVYIAKEGISSISVTHWSISVVLETVRVELEKLKITASPVDIVENITI